MATPPAVQDSAARRDPLVRTYAPDGASSPPRAGVPELGGRKDGTEPTRFGDWEKQGRCIDF